MSVTVVIPARYASTRYPGKPLVPPRGADGVARTLIEWTWLAGKSVRGIDRLVVATDDDRIAADCARIGAEVVMTSVDCANGTERCADALARMDGPQPDIVVNLQGDAPLTPAWFVEELAAALAADPAAEVATPVLNCTGAMRAELLADRAAGRVGGTTAVFGADGGALYFSKEVIPFVAAPPAPDAPSPVWHHVGVYAYRPEALAAYSGWPEGRLEALEGLEQLRFLEHGRRVLCVPVEARGRQFWELNNPEDVPKIEAMMAAMGMA